MLNEYTGNTYDGTILSTDTKYIALKIQWKIIFHLQKKI